MALAFKKGDTVKVKGTDIVGEVVKPEVVDDDVQYHVSYVVDSEVEGEDGEEHTRAFPENKLIIQN